MIKPINISTKISSQTVKRRGMQTEQTLTYKTKIELLEKLNKKDLADLVDATEATMLDTYGFSVGFRKWQPPMKQDLEGFFKGVMLIPERKLIVGRIEDTIVGSLQLLLPHKSNQVSSFMVLIYDLFVVQWARFSGIATSMLNFAEKYAKDNHYKLLRLSVRANTEAAIYLFEKFGYKRWGTLDKYEIVGKEIVGGYFYYKDL